VLLNRRSHTTEELDAMAEALGKSHRSLRRYRELASHLDLADTVRPPGRPPLSEGELNEARRVVEEQLDRQGPDTGEEPVWRGAGGVIPRSRVRRVLRENKAARRRRRRVHRKESRVSVTVNARDVIWALDATHLGRRPGGDAVLGEVVREVASTRTLGVTAGPAATGREVVHLLEGVRRERGGAPLVLLTDNGGPYKSKAVKDWCKAHGVLHLKALPHTPQHNGQIENGMHGLKLGAALGKGVLVLDIADARARLQESARRINEHRVRRTRGWRTAVEADRALPHWSELTTRQRFLEEAACATELLLLNSTGARAERRAAREAILGTLQRLNLITRTRGGRLMTALTADRVL